VQAELQAEQQHIRELLEGTPAAAAAAVPSEEERLLRDAPLGAILNQPELRQQRRSARVIERQTPEQMEEARIAALRAAAAVEPQRFFAYHTRRPILRRRAIIDPDSSDSD